MGPPISKAIFQVPELKDHIFQNVDFLKSALGVIVEEKNQGKSVSLDVGAEGSLLQVEVKNAHQAILKLRYVVDNDSNPENGRVYVVDRFYFDPTSKSFESLKYSRKVFTTSEDDFWGDLLQKLEEDSEENPPSPEKLRHFFYQVIVPLEISVPAEEVIPLSRKKDFFSSLQKISEDLQRQSSQDFSRPFLLFSSHFDYTPLRSQRFSHLLARRENTASILPLQVAEDQWLDSIKDPTNFLPFLAGSVFFRFGRMLSFDVLSEWGMSGSFAKIVSSGVGVALEGSAFEAAERIRRGQDWENFGGAALQNVETFALFHASGAFFKNVSQSPWINHLGAWATFHGVNEFQRGQGLRPLEGDYPLRVFLDAGFYMHAAASGAVVGEMLGPEHPLFFLQRGLKHPVRLVSKDELSIRGYAQIMAFLQLPEPQTRVILRSVKAKLELAGQSADGNTWNVNHRGYFFSLTRDDRGFLMLQDLRCPPYVHLEENPSRFPIRVNAGEVVRPGEVTYLKADDLVNLGKETFFLTLQEPSLFERELYAQTREFKDEWWKRVEAANSLDDIKGILRGMDIPSASEELKVLEDCLQGKVRVDSLSPLFQLKVLTLMDSENKAVAPHLPHGFEPHFEKDHPLYQGHLTEQRYHVFQAAFHLHQQIQNAADVEAILKAVKNYPLPFLEITPRGTMLLLLDGYQRGNYKLSGMPRDFAVRQRLADIEELRFYRQHQNGGFRPNYGLDASFERNCLELDKEKRVILDLLQRLRVVEGSAKTYIFEDLKEIIEEVLERGKPLEMISTESGVRDSVKKYMSEVIAAASKLFSHEWSLNEKQNYFTGEYFGDISNGEQYLQTRYRFARMLLNEKRGLPIFGEPTEREKGTLVWFAKEKLKVQGDIHFADVQWAIRDHLQNFTPTIQEGLRTSNQEERALVMETFFGTQQHRMMSDPYKAFEVARFLGEVGFYREVGVTLEIVDGMLFTNLSLGDLGSVHPEKNSQFFVLHTHPEEYLNQKGQYMGAQQYQGRTIALDVGDTSENTLNVLFSHQDVRLFVRHASEIFAVATREPRLDLSIFYDRQTRVFKNWVQHPYGMAEMKVYLSPTGVAQKVEIQYGVKPEAQGDHRHLFQAIALKAMHAELHIPVQVEEVDIQGLEAQVPYAGR